MTKQTRGVLWEGPPSAPNQNAVLGDSSCLGIVGMTLRETLQDLSAEIESRPKSIDSKSFLSDEGIDEQKNKTLDGGSVNQADAKAKYVFGKKSIDHILQAFGEAVARSQVAETSTIDEPYLIKSLKSKNVKRSKSIGPSIILRGRLDHFNRRNSKWRLLVRDVEIVERKFLDPNRRSVERLPFWKVAGTDVLSIKPFLSGETAALSMKQQPLQIVGPFEILAYDDKE